MISYNNASTSEERYLEKIPNIRITKGKRKEMFEISNTEENLRIERLKQIIDQEQQLANLKHRYEEKMANMKETHLREINDIQLQHFKKIQKLEIQINNAKLKVIERQIINDENIDPSM